MTSPLSPRRMSDARFRLVVLGGIALAIGAMALAVSRTNTDDTTPPEVASRPEVVERLIPPANTDQVRQTEIGIDLAPGYEGLLAVNGVEIPADQIRAVEAENQIFFAPREGRVIEELPGGRTCVNAVVWRSADGRSDRDQRFTWCFSVH